MQNALQDLKASIKSCNLCADRFAATHSAHKPRPVVWFNDSAKILIAGQAPGMRVHESGKPFWDRSGDRLRHWLGVDEDSFYDQSLFAIVPMAFCFPGYNAAGSDLPPPKVCADTWRDQILDQLPDLRLTLLIGGYAQKWHLGTRASVTDTVASWRELSTDVLPLPHPSWRTTGWAKKNEWFERDLLPVLRNRVREALK